MIKYKSASKFLKFAFGKYFLYDIHRKSRIYCMSLVIL